MTHQLTINVDDTVYKALKPMVEQNTIGLLLHDFMQKNSLWMQNCHKKQPISFITSLRGTLHRIDTSDIRDEADRS